MWPFSKKAKEPPKPSPRSLRIDALEKALPLGMEFDYLGTRHRVTKHWV